MAFRSYRLNNSYNYTQISVAFNHTNSLELFANDNAWPEDDYNIFLVLSRHLLVNDQLVPHTTGC